jgi:SAM-dependent methyltransferase
MSQAVFRQIVAASVAPYAGAGRFAQGFARGKLLGDPAFVHLLQQGLLGDAKRVLDLGCGQGLLASLLLACGQRFASADWPADWPKPATAARVHGIELMPRDVERAKTALGLQADFELGDIALTEFPASDVVVILDVLHYLPYEAQQQVLDRVRTALAPSGRLLLRVGDADGGFGFRFSNWVDQVVTRIRGHRLGSLYCRPLAEWISLLRIRGFEVQSRPMSQGTLFANVLLIADLRAPRS